MERGFCFASANRLKVRTYCSHDNGKEQWSWVAGVWDFWLVRGGKQALPVGLDHRLFDESLASFINMCRNGIPMLPTPLCWILPRGKPLMIPPD